MSCQPALAHQPPAVLGIIAGTYRIGLFFFLVFFPPNMTCGTPKHKWRVHAYFGRYLGAGFLQPAESLLVANDDEPCKKGRGRERERRGGEGSGLAVTALVEGAQIACCWPLATASAVLWRACVRGCVVALVYHNTQYASKQASKRRR